MTDDIKRGSPEWHARDADLSALAHRPGQWSEYAAKQIDLFRNGSISAEQARSRIAARARWTSW